MVCGTGESDAGAVGPGEDPRDRTPGEDVRELAPELGADHAPPRELGPGLLLTERVPGVVAPSEAGPRLTKAPLPNSENPPRDDMPLPANRPGPPESKACAAASAAEGTPNDLVAAGRLKDGTAQAFARGERGGVMAPRVGIASSQTWGNG